MYSSRVSASKPAPIVVASHGRRDRDEHDGDDHHQHGARQHGPPEDIGGRFVVVTEGGVDRHEGCGEAGGDQDVERDLRDAERGVVGVELRTGAVRVREDPIADDAQQEVRGSSGMTRISAPRGKIRSIERTGHRHGRSRHGRPPCARPPPRRGQCDGRQPPLATVTVSLPPPELPPDPQPEASFFSVSASFFGSPRASA